MLPRALLLLALWAGATHAQIVGPDQSDPYKLITLGCDCIVPDNATVKIDWRFSEEVDWQVIDPVTGQKVVCTAPPGVHWCETVVITQTYQEIDVLIPDEEEPQDVTKADWGKVRVAQSLDLSRYERTFEVLGTPPGPAPGPQPEPEPGPGPQPEPEPDPDPVGGLAGDIRKMYQALPAGVYDKSKASALADNYLSVGSQGGDPARNSGWNLDTFRTKTKDLNYQVLTTEELAQWAVPFFRPLAEHMAKTFAQRNLAHGDAAGISKLWTEYGEAMKKALY